MLATASWPPVASTSGSATGLSQSVIGVHTFANWIHPPNAASTASTATVNPIDHSTRRSCAACGGCSRTYADCSPPKTTNSIRNVYSPVRNVPAIAAANST